MLKKHLVSLIALVLFSSVSFSNVEVLPKNLVALSSPVGNQLFLRSYRATYFWPLMLQFESQENLAYCSIASSVMVLNALNIPAPIFNKHGPYQMFTQDNFFTEAVEKVLPDQLVKKHGATLDQISQALKTFPVTVRTVHADQMTLSEFRVLAKNIVASKNSYMIINFLRKGLDEQGMGHMSPLAAYDQGSDRFLLLDVARYRYPSVWIKTKDLWNAMHTKDSGANAYRGFVIVSRKR